MSLARDGADQITMHPHSEAYHIDCFLNVGLPVAPLLAVINLVDDNVVLLFAVGGNIESRKPGFAAVLGAGKEVENLLFLGDDTRLLLATVGDALLVKLMATCRISSVMPFLLSDFFFLRPFHIENTEQTILWIVSRLRAAFAYLRFTLS